MLKMKTTQVEGIPGTAVGKADDIQVVNTSPRASEYVPSVHALEPPHRTGSEVAVGAEGNTSH